MIQVAGAIQIDVTDGTSITLADTDKFLVDDKYNSICNASQIKTYIDGGAGGTDALTRD